MTGIRTALVIVPLLLVACSRKSQGDEAMPRATAAAPEVAAPAPAAAKPAATKPHIPKRHATRSAAATSAAPSLTGAGSADACCCVDKDNPGGQVFADHCTTQGGRCVTPWTEQCREDWHDQWVADQRNAADDECPSHDHHDCDGDGFAQGIDKDDDDPKVH